MAWRLSRTLCVELGGCPEFNGPVVNNIVDINIVDDMLTITGREGFDEIFDRSLGKR